MLPGLPAKIPSLDLHSVLKHYTPINKYLTQYVCFLIISLLLLMKFRQLGFDSSVALLSSPALLPLKLLFPSSAFKLNINNAFLATGTLNHIFSVKFQVC